MLFIVPLAMTAMVVLMAVGAWAVQLLWNWLLPPLFGWHTIGFWQALGMLILCRLLFGRSGFGRGTRNRGAWRRRRPGMWSRMSPEEREEMRRWLWERAGRPPAPDSPSGPAGI
jgi:hypothetical protein